MSGLDELSTPIYNERGDEDDDELVDPEDFELTEDEEDFEDDDVD